MAVRGRTSLPLTPCSVEGCNTPTNRRYKGIFYCAAHRKRIYSFGEPEPSHLKKHDLSKPKKCRTCGIHKSVSDFSVAPRMRDGISHHCKQCINKKRSEREKDSITALVPFGGTVYLKPYPLRNPKIIKKKKKRTQCVAFGCEKQTSLGWRYCTCHSYYMEKFSSLIPQEKLICSQCGKEQHYSEFTAKYHHVLHPQMKCHTCVAKNKRLARRKVVKRRIERLKKDPVIWAEYRREQNKKKHERIKNNPVRLGQKRIQHRVYLNNRRSRKKQNGGTHTKADILQLLDLQKNKCAACKNKLGKKYHVDHVIPIANGGGSNRENLQILCPGCNRAKCAKDSLKFMREIGYLL